MVTHDESILIWGLTGAEKSTLSIASGRELGVDVVSGFTIRRHLLGLTEATTETERSYWLFDDGAVHADKARMLGSTLEDDLDDWLLRRLLTGPPSIFDTWFLPWAAPPSTFSICLDVAFSVRASRIVDALDTSVPCVHIAESIQRKDERSAEFARQRFGIDILLNRDPFDVIVGLDSEVALTDIADLLSRIARLYLGRPRDSADTDRNRTVRVDLLRRVPDTLRASLSRE